MVYVLQGHPLHPCKIIDSLLGEVFQLFDLSLGVDYFNLVYFSLFILWLCLNFGVIVLDSVSVLEVSN
jgi:hypothetical protein